MEAIGLPRGVSGPLQTAWINQKLDPRVRATINSMFGQVDAISQTMGGPVIGLIAKAFSVKLAVSLASLMLSPALLFIQRANRIQKSDVETHEPVSQHAA